MCTPILDATVLKELLAALCVCLSEALAALRLRLSEAR
jgi:hypothetical protein